MRRHNVCVKANRASNTDAAAAACSGLPVPAVHDQPAPSRTTLSSARPRAPASSELGRPRSGSRRIACTSNVQHSAVSVTSLSDHGLQPAK
jgi:hypothetical protein